MKIEMRSANKIEVILESHLEQYAINKWFENGYIKVVKHGNGFSLVKDLQTEKLSMDYQSKPKIDNPEDGD